MAYSAIPKSAQHVIPAPPQTGASPLRVPPISSTASRPRAGGSDALRPAAAANLLQFLILLAVICGLICLYVWQADAISVIRIETQTMNRQAQALERRNVSLMLECARWDAPGYIEAESSRSDMVVAQEPIRVRLPEVSERQVQLGSEAEEGTAIGEMAAWLPGSLTIGSRTR